MFRRTVKIYSVRFIRTVTIFTVILSFVHSQTTTLDPQDSVTSNQASPPYLYQILSFWGGGLGGSISGTLLGRAIDPSQGLYFLSNSAMITGAFVGFWFGGFKAMELVTEKHGAPEGSEAGAIIAGYIVGESFNFVMDALPSSLRSQIEFVQAVATIGAFLAGYNYKYIKDNHKKQKKINDEKKAVRNKTKND